MRAERPFVGLVVVWALSVLTSNPARADLISHWTFDDHFEDEVSDNDGEFRGAFEPTFVEDRDGNPDSAIELNITGVDEFIFVPQNTGLPLYQHESFSVSMWVRGGVQNDRRVWSESTTRNNSALYNLGTQNQGADGRFDLFVRGDGGGVAAPHVYSATEPFDDTWHHIVFVDENGTGTFWMDGSQDPAAFQYTRPDMDLDITTIGGILRGGPCCLFQGAIDDVRIFDHALTEEEIHEICPPEPCPEEGDTHCDDLLVEGPPDDLAGPYTITALDAVDDSDDRILYTFTRDDGQGFTETVGPQAENSVRWTLGAGTWTITATVDDDPLCDDVADDATCTTEIEVVAAEEMMIAHYTFDGHLDDETGNTEATPVSGFEPAYVDGFDGSEEGAAEFNGIDDLISVNYLDQESGGLALFGNEAYTVAMWVKGGPQPDFRVFSEASTQNRNPLVNIGTQAQGVTGQVDLYIRNGPAQLNHRQSQREAFIPDEWHHICWVDVGGEAVLYIDGQLDGTNFNYNKPEMPTDTTTIGGILRDTPSHWFIGAIDDVRLFNFALSPEQVLELIPEPDDCPDEGDTHCDDISVDAPANDGAGTWTFTALGAVDDSGDEILYTFTATPAEGEALQSGPSASDTASFALTAGEWTVAVTVDDDILCRDVADDATCSVDVEAVVPKPILISHWSFDEDLLDSQPAANHGNMVGGEPLFVEGFDGNPEGAIQFDGVDDFVQVEQVEGLPLYHLPAYSIAMWVRGDGTVGAPNADDRVWSESTITGNAPLFNLGTHPQGAGPELDVFIRANGSTPMPHTQSIGAVFDNTWHHIVWVDEGGDAALYIDGVLDPQDFSYVKPSLDSMPLDITTIGGILRGGPCCLFTGEIDDVCIFNFRLSDEEALTLFEEGCSDDRPAREDCEREGDEDGNGLADCEDPVCEDLPACDTGPTFVRGDANSSGAIDLTDGVVGLNFLFLGGNAPPCADAADADDDGALSITDSVTIFGFLFTGGPPPDPPAPSATTYPAEDCGEDPTDADPFGCEALSPTCAVP